MNTAILNIVIPISTALVIALISQLKKGAGKSLAILGIVSTFGFVVYLLYHTLFSSLAVAVGNWKAPFGIVLFYSPLTTGAVLLCLFISLVILLNQKEKQADEFYILFLISITGVSGIIHTTDLFNLFVFIELLCLSLYGLIGQSKSQSGPAAGFKYMVNGIVTGMFMLLGIGIVYSATGTLSMAALSDHGILKPVAGFFAGLLIISPLLLESKQLPFGTWVPGVYKSVSKEITILLSSIAGLASLVVLWRFAGFLFIDTSAFGGVSDKLRVVLLGIGIVTMLAGEISALTEKNLHKVLAFSSMGQSGLIVIGISLAASGQAAVGIVILLITHTLAKAALFLIAGFFTHQRKTQSWRNMTGTGRLYPFAGGLFLLNSMALLGLPPLSGFWGKYFVSMELVKAGGVFYIALTALVVAAVIEGLYYFRIGLTFFTKTDVSKEGKYPGVLIASLIIISTIIILLGIITPLISTDIQKFMQDVLNPITVFGSLMTG
ncbi:MAG: hypothetical protein JXJ04_23605 [Spirochaetales bacterium]|nr:hypothetical protein [Spirochaetales bacterium]